MTDTQLLDDAKAAHYKGSVTIKATEQLYHQMIDQRQTKTLVLLRWVDKDITVQWQPKRVEMRSNTLYTFHCEEATLVNSFTLGHVSRAYCNC
jgi:hypothetical protein